MQFTYWKVTYEKYGERRTARVYASTRAGARVTAVEMLGPAAQVLKIRPA